MGRDVEAILTRSMARTLFVDWWGTREEEKGRYHSGQDLFDVAPQRTPRRFRDEAMRLVGRFEERNHMAFVSLAFRAFVADGTASYDGENIWDQVSDETLETFGHYAAMCALGHGVAWEDDHAESGIDYPHIEIC